MKRFMMLGMIVLITFMAGCSVDGGDVVEKDKNKIMTCRDTRDGEVFSFNTNSISNVRHGICAPHTFDIITTEGKSKTLSSEMESYIKCDKKDA